MDVRRELTQRYLEIGALLNTIEDDDERERLQEHGETVLNDELFAGSQNRQAVAPINAAVATLTRTPRPLGHSMRVQLQDGEPPDDYLTRRGPYLADSRSENDRSL